MKYSRSQLAKFLPDNESIRLFEDIMNTAERAVNTAERADINAGNVLVLSADVSNSTTTLVDVLSIPVAGGAIYRFEFTSIYTGTDGCRWTVDGVAFDLLSYTSDYSLSATARTVNNASAYGVPAAANASTVPGISRVFGIIKPTVNGTLKLQMASAGVGPITAKAGSFVNWSKIA